MHFIKEKKINIVLKNYKFIILINSKDSNAICYK